MLVKRENDIYLKTNHVEFSCSNIEEDILRDILKAFIQFFKTKEPLVRRFHSYSWQMLITFQSSGVDIHVIYDDGSETCIYPHEDIIFLAEELVFELKNNLKFWVTRIPGRDEFFYHYREIDILKECEDLEMYIKRYKNFIALINNKKLEKAVQSLIIECVEHVLQNEGDCFQLRTIENVLYFSYTKHNDKDGIHYICKDGDTYWSQLRDINIENLTHLINCLKPKAARV